jgi:hypothetical protein
MCSSVHFVGLSWLAIAQPQSSVSGRSTVGVAICPDTSPIGRLPSAEPAHLALNPATWIAEPNPNPPFLLGGMPILRIAFPPSGYKTRCLAVTSGQIHSDARALGANCLFGHRPNGGLHEHWCPMRPMATRSFRFTAAKRSVLLRFLNRSPRVSRTSQRMSSSQSKGPVDHGLTTGPAKRTYPSPAAWMFPSRGGRRVGAACREFPIDLADGNRPVDVLLAAPSTRGPANALSRRSV